MNKSTKYLILLTVFAVLTVISAATVYTALQIPDSQTSTNVTGTYISTANYDCTAQLNQSIIYDNRTSIKPTQGILYTKLIKQFDISLSYQFNTTFQIPTTIQYTLTRVLRTNNWEYPLPTINSNGTTDQKMILAKIPSISTDEIDSIVNRINKETGSFDTIYTLDIKPTFIITGVSSRGSIDETFEPTLRISTNSTKQGYVTTVDGLSQYQTGEFTQTQTTTNPSVSNQRYASYALAALSLIGLTFTSWLSIKTRDRTPKRETEKQIKDHKDIIVEAASGLKLTGVPKIVNLRSMDELVKTSEILAKPIIHSIDAEHRNVFYVVDNNTKYQYEESTPSV